MKKALKIGLTCLLLLPIIFYISIVIINDCIADGIEKELRAIELPPKTELVESASVAGKLYGGGNGMQYYGVLLIKSDLSEQELEDYYAKYIDYHNYAEMWGHVSKQETEIIFDYHDYKFKKFDEKENNFVVVAIKANNPVGAWNFLDCDIRGH